MSRPKNPVPSYRLHKQSGQAVVTLAESTGRRRDVLLGRYGSDESRLEYSRVIAEWNAGGARKASAQSDLTMNELLVLYVHHVEAYYRRADGVPTSEVRNIKEALRWLKKLYGHTPAAMFTTLSLEAIRQAMIDHGLCRNRINKDTARIRRMFRWGAAKHHVQASIYHELATLEGLRAGRSAAKETAPIRAVPLETVEATLPWLAETIADMVRLQLESGMRSGELLSMRTGDIDRTGATWAYRPSQHKTMHHGQERVIWLGPRCQEIIRGYLKANPEAFLFSPAESVRRFRERQRANRKSKVQPSQRDRAKRKPKKQPGDRYEVSTYGQRIRVGIQKANAAARKANPENPTLLPHWHPHQLRHACATRLRKDFGLDAARVILGHRSPKITEIYAEADYGKAREIMAKIG